MSFFDTKLMGDLLQRMGDHKRVEQFLTTQTLIVMFSLLNFVIFGMVLLCYNWLIFAVFFLGSLLYGGWMALFLNKRKVLDYELFERQAMNNAKTYQFITSMQEIKLQDCERRRRWEWEDVQADLFDVQMKSLKLQQKQEAGYIFINEVKNMVITVLAAATVIQGSMTLGMMLAVQYIIGLLNSPVEQLPLKYNTQIGPNGIGLSQGQKQRILIARAIYKNPPYIFLDEATNALDAENERVIVENIHDFYLGRTVVVVAHRLSTVKDADQIIVMDKGRIVEVGNHASLIVRQGTYYNLVKNQLELGN